MKKKVFVFLAIFVLMSSNRGCTDYFLIVGIDFFAVFIDVNSEKLFKKENQYQNDRQNAHFAYTSSVKGKLIFIISYETEFLYGTKPFANLCYATSRGRATENELLRNTFSLTFDKEFTFHGNTIPAMTDIFNIETVTEEIDVYKNYILLRNAKGDVVDADLVLDFSDNFFKNSVFDTTEEYIVTFSCKTSDDKFFEKSITIKFEK
jgi:hypothetical protein